jgi:N12 class adenine-specific DNA methylase
VGEGHQALYPGANVLAASRKDFAKERRKALFAKIATGDWDAVIVAHKSFGFIPMPPDAERDILEEQRATSRKRSGGARAARARRTCR